MSENQAREILVALQCGAGPLQRQVEDQLRSAIREGRLAAGERLPSSRTLAAEGWLLITPRSGPRVAKAPAETRHLSQKGSDPLSDSCRVSARP